MKNISLKNSILLKIILALSVIALAVFGLVFALNVQPQKVVKADQTDFETDDGEFHFYPNSDGTYTITGGSEIEHYIWADLESNLIIHHYYYIGLFGDRNVLCSSDGGQETRIEVTCIGANGFEQLDVIDTLVIEDGITGIDDQAFYLCTALSEITFPNTLEYIGESAFNQCGRLDSLVIPDSCTEILDSAFADCGYLDNVTMSENITHIGLDAFDGCDLGHIALPYNSGWYIGSSSNTYLYLYYIADFSTFTIHPNCEIIGTRVFQEYESAHFEIPASILYIDESAFQNCNDLETVSFESGCNLAAINQNAFEGCTNLEEVQFPSTLSKIDWYAFSGCTSLYLVDIEGASNNDSMLSVINGSAFDGCTSLTSINLPNRCLREIASFAFSGTALISITIPACVEEIRYRAFYNCSDLERVTFEDRSQLNSFGNRVFEGCSSLEEMTLPFAGLKPNSVGNNSPDGYFYSLFGSSRSAVPANLTTITIGGDYYAAYDTIIESNAFYQLTQIQNVTIGSTVTQLKNAFGNCTGLTTVTIESDHTNIVGSPFSNCNNIQTVNFATSGTGYSFYNGTLTLANQDTISNTGWSGITELILEVNWLGGGTNVHYFDDYIFDHPCNLKSFTFPDSVIDPGANGFYGCTFQPSVSDNGLYYLASNNNPYFYLWKTDEDISSCTINPNCKILGTGTFTYCEDLITLTVPSSVRVIGKYSINCLPNLETLYLNEGLEIIRDWGISDLPKLKSVTFPSTFTSQGEYSEGLLWHEEMDGDEFELESIIINPWEIDFTYELPSYANWYYNGVQVTEIDNDFIASVLAFDGYTYFIELTTDSTASPLTVFLYDTDEETVLARYSGTTIPNLTPNNHPGYVFNGWRYGEGNTSAIPTYGSELVDANSDGNLTLYAVWGYDDLSTGVELPSKTSVVMVSVGLSVVAILSVAGIVFCIKRIGYYKKKR